MKILTWARFSANDRVFIDYADERDRTAGHRCNDLYFVSCRVISRRQKIVVWPRTGQRFAFDRALEAVGLKP
jgi:hypothetical protein